MTKQISKKSQRLFALLLAVAMLFSVMPMNAIAVTGTNVNEDGFIEVRTIGDLYNVRDDLTANYILMNDIDLTIATAQGGDWDYGGRGWNPIGSNDIYDDGEFSGIFDGNGYSIIGMRIEYTSSTKPSGMGDDGYVGLFSKVTGEVRNLSMKNVNIVDGYAKGYLRVGAIAGSNTGAITNCSVTGAVIGTTSSSVWGCYAGGIAGYNVDGTISKCYNTATVKITAYDDSHYAGGICAFGGTISNCYNTGVASSYNSGGICAGHSTQSTSVTNCYNIGSASYAIAGGSKTTITGGYYLTGTGKGFTGATELTVGQTTLQSSYRNFDFDSIWIINTDANYPYPQLRSNIQDMRVIENVVIASEPNKKEYKYGEQIDLTGALLEIQYTNVTSELIDITEDMASGYSATTPGTQAIEVKYKGFSTFFTVKVNEKVFVPVYTIADLYNVRDDLTANYILMNDIDLTEATASGGDWDFGGKGWNPIGSNDVYSGEAFAGEFDGNGHSIIGMRISIPFDHNSSDGIYYVGLFARVTGYVHDLKMENVDISIDEYEKWYAGAVCGSNAGEISRCSSNGQIIDASSDDYLYMGGIAGYNSGDINECFNTAKVIGGKYAGGIVAYSDTGNITNCYNTGKISASITRYQYAGGISAYNYHATITNCYNIGTIKGYTGNYAAITDVGSATSSYYLANSGPGTTGVSLTEAQMKATASFRGFDFENVWVLNEFANHPYPQLRNNIQDMSESASLVSIIAPPTKTTYYVGDTLDLTDGIVKVVYVSGKEEIKNITSDMLSEFDMNTAGEQDVVVSIAGASDTYKINVKERPVVESIEITSEPNKSVFAVGTEFDFTGAKAFVTYVGGESETVSLTTENTTGYNINHVGKQTVVFTLGGKSASFEIEVVGVQIEKIVLTSLPDKLDFIEGQELDLTGMVVTAVMNNGFENVIAEGYTVSGYSNVPGTYEITIAYREKTATFNVTVAKKKLLSLGINSLPDKLEYVSGQEFNANGMQIIATYDNGDIVVAEDYTISGFDSVPGIKNVVISLDDKSVSFPVKVIARVITEFKLASLPSKLDYIEYDSLDISGMRVEATYNDGITEEVTDYTLTGFSSNPGTHTIVIAYKGFAESFEIDVAPRVLIDIKVKAPNKVTYYIGEEFDGTGMVITACYNNGQEIVVDDYQMTGFDSAASGAKTITIAYGGISRSFAVAVQERSVIETGGNMIVGNLIARLGETVVIPVNVTKNTGIAGFTHTINFDATALKLVSVDTVGGYADGTVILNDEKIANGEITILWFGSADVEGDGVVYNLTFEILETAQDGNAEITISFDDNDNGNISGENVIFGTMNGFVEVRSYWLGDLDGNRKYEMVDLLHLAQYVSGKEMTLTDKQKLSADVNEDGFIDIHDVIMLNQWLLVADM